MSSKPSQPFEKAMEKALISALDHATHHAAEEDVRGVKSPLRLVIALSGGADSTALLRGASQYLGQRFTILALHADHGLHPESGRWAEHCRRLCKRLGVPIEVESVNVSDAGNLEAAARDARYGLFARYLTGNDLLLMGHHQQDQAETLLLRTLQGRGLVGMRYYGSLGQGHFIRPFLSLPKDQLIQYLRAAGEEWIEDPSNQQTNFDRNYLRQEVMPALTQRWPNAADALARVSADAGAQVALLQRYAAELPNQVPFDRVPQSRAEARVWLRAFLASRGHHRVTDVAIDEYFRQQRESGRAAMTLASMGSEGSGHLYAWRGELFYERADDVSELPWPQANSPLPWRIRWRQQVLEVDLAQGQSPDVTGYRGQLSILHREQLLATDEGLAHRLKKLFQQGQIPPWRRAGYPLVCDADGLVCMPGIWRRETSVLGGDLSAYCRIRWLTEEISPSFEAKSS
jgi:tRNA(Ile)-lysidine synthetase-like protein